MAASDEEYKLVVLGSGGVGKSALIIRFLAHQFIEEYEPTVEDSYRKSFDVDGIPCVLDILDTSASAISKDDSMEDQSMQDQWIREAQMFLIVYNINTRSSFNEAKLIRNKIMKTKEGDEAPPIVLVGSKCDLNENRQKLDINDPSNENATKPPSHVEGELLAQSWGQNVSFFEVSAKEEINHEEVFHEAVRLMRGKMVQYPQHIASEPATHICCKAFVYLCLFGWFIDLIYNCISNKCCCRNRNTQQYEQHLFYSQQVSSNILSRSQSLSFYPINKIRVFHDDVRKPMISLKNFKIHSKFSYVAFVKSICCGVCLPLVIMLQTIIFVIYSEHSCSKAIRLMYPKRFPFDQIHQSLLLDLLGLVIGRYPNQDPDAAKGRVWFLRQNLLQKLQRVVMTSVLCLAFLLCYWNLFIFISADYVLRVSLMESVGPFILFWILWLLLSFWIAYESSLDPQMPSTLRLRSIKLRVGDNFKRVTDAHKFIRAYKWSKNKSSKSTIRILIVICLGLLYAAIPHITRHTLGDSSEDINSKAPKEYEFRMQIYAFFVNFIIISAFMYVLELQYNKHYENYREWMYALTMLLTKTTSNKEETDSEQDIHHPRKGPRKGIHFCQDIFLSLSLKNNALGWLEIRSFLAAEGQLLFAEQQLPTLWILFITISICIFLLYRVFFIDGNPLQSILFNGAVMLCIICVLLLLKIAATGYGFEYIQRLQERLLGEQRFFMRCAKRYIQAQNTGTFVTPQPSISAFYNTSKNSKLKDSFSLRDSLKTDYTTNMVQHMLKGSPASRSQRYPVNASPGEEMPALADICLGSGRKQNASIVMIPEEEKYAEQEPLMKRVNTSKRMSYEQDLRFLMMEMQKDIKVMTSRSDNAEDTSDIFGFIDNMLFIVERKDIFPRLYKIKLNSVLATAIGCVFVSGIAAVAKLLHAF